jgi:hypothetical protein
MQMTKRAIPRIATTGLVLGATACSSSNDPNPSSISNDLCAGFIECDPYFYDYWDSFGQCDNYYTGYYADLADAAFFEVGSVCEDALLDYAGCYWAVYRATCDAIDAENSCDDEYADFYYACN